MAKKANVTIKTLGLCTNKSTNKSASKRSNKSTNNYISDFYVKFEIIDRQSFCGIDHGCVLDNKTPYYCDDLNIEFIGFYYVFFKFLSDHINGKFEIEYSGKKLESVKLKND